MICSHCGQKIPDGSRFCPKCGQAPTPSAAPAPEMTYNAGGNAPAGDAAAYGAPLGGKKSSGGKGLFKILIPVILAVIVVIAVVLFVTGHSKKTVNLSDYVTITIDGYDTVGTASYELNYEQFEEDYGDKFQLTAKQVKKLAGDNEVINYAVTMLGGYEQVASYYTGTQIADEILGCYNGELSKDSGISIGDEITLTALDPDEDLETWAAIVGYEFVTEDVTITADDLAEIATFDPFDGVDIRFYGEAPNGTASLESRGSDDACYDLSYSISPREGLSNGDTVTVTVSYDYGDMNTDLAEAYGRVPSATSKEYTVTGLTSYAASASEIPSDALDLMKSQAEDTFRAQVASYYTATSAELVDVQYIGNFFMSAKDGVSTYNENTLYLVYKCRAHLWYANENGSYDGMTDYYWYCRFDDILLTDDGQYQVDLSDYDTPYKGTSFKVESHVPSGWSTVTWTVYGYEKLDMMYNQLVTVNIDKFKAENNVTDISFDAGTTVEASAEETTEETAEESTEATTEEVTE